MTPKEFLDNRVDLVLTRDEQERSWLADLLEEYAKQELEQAINAFETLNKAGIIAQENKDVKIEALQKQVEELKGLLKMGLYPGEYSIDSIIDFREKVEKALKE